MCGVFLASGLGRVVQPERQSSGSSLLGPVLPAGWHHGAPGNPLSAPPRPPQGLRLALLPFQGLWAQWQAPSPDTFQGQCKGHSVSIGGATERGLPGCQLLLRPVPHPLLRSWSKAATPASQPALPLQPWSPSVATDMPPEALACLLPLCALPPERAPFWLAVPLRCPILKDSLEDAPWLCPGNPERGRNPCRPRWWGWGLNPLGLGVTTAPSLQLRAGGLGLEHVLTLKATAGQRPPGPPAPSEPPSCRSGCYRARAGFRILVVHFSKVSFFFVPECDSLPAHTHRYPLVPGSLDFFFTFVL